MYKTINNPIFKIKSAYMKKILFVLAAISVFGSVSSQDFGLQLYSLRNQLKKDFKGGLDSIHEFGIRNVEGNEFYGITPEKFRKGIDEQGLKLVSFAVDYDDLKKDLTPVIQRARLLGVSFLVCYWIPHKSSNFDMSNVDEAAAIFNQAGKILKENGIQLCYHNHGYEFQPSANGTLFDDLLMKTNPDYVSYELDVFWAKQGCVDPVQLMKKYPSRFMLMHLKDRQIGTRCDLSGNANEETNVVLGNGDVNIKKVMRAAKKTNVKYFFIEDESTRVMQQIPQSLGYLKSLK
jgi:sugar phosphate isomerase/epimerase